MKSTSWKFSVLVSVLVFAGCGGGDSSTTKESVIPTDSVSTVSGTVPGTLIEAFCTDGSYYFVKSTSNNTSEHPFEIEIPSTVGCSLVMTTNEDDIINRVVTQIGIITPDASGTLFTAATDIDLGHIPLAMDPSNINDINGDHVSDDILNIQVDGTSIVVELENHLDDDNDGLVNIYEDYDDDGISNYYDGDDDNDGIDDTHDTDNDGDDIEGNDNDYDDDGIDNDTDVDDDNDGIDDSLDSDDNNNNTANIILPATYTANPGRLLGAQCAQCHGTNGISTNEWESIAGENFEHKTYSEEIMNAQAMGYTEDEKLDINNWLKTLSSND